MSHPHSDSTAPAFSGQSKTLFVIETKAEAVLYLNDQGVESTIEMNFETPHAALDWCIEHRAGMVFALAGTPADN